MSTPWVGKKFPKARVKLLVLGESRYDKGFPDRRIIEWVIRKQFEGGQRATFTKFERAILGVGHSEIDRQNFWNRTLFHNYNVNFFPGRSRMQLTYSRREDPQNVRSLRAVLKKYKPTHVIVWGKTNWDSIDVQSPWTDHRIPGAKLTYCRTIIDDRAILFTHIPHPSTAFSPTRWAPILNTFLALRT